MATATQDNNLYGLSKEAYAAVQEIRKTAGKHLGMRPEISLVASAMLVSAARQPNVLHEIATYGARVYQSGAGQDVANDAKVEQTADA